MKTPIGSVRAFGLLLVLFAAAAACNSPPVTPFEMRPFFEQDDVVVQPPVRKVPIDLLFVIDNSGSMAEEQNNLAANFGQFIDAINQTRADYHIAIVSTDMSDPTQSGRFLAKPGNPKILTKDTPEVARVFAENARLGTMGDGFEKGLAAIEAALSPPLVGGDNAGFLRPEALLGVIVVSDEEDCSHPPGAIPEFDGNECTRNIGLMYPVQRYRDFLLGLKAGNASRVFVGAITGPDLPAGTVLEACSSGAACASGSCGEHGCCPLSPSLTACRTDTECASVAGSACHGRKCLPANPERALAPNTCSCYAAGTGSAVPGTRYLDLLRTFGNNGLYASICSADWGASLRDLADLAIDLVCKFPLSTMKENPNVLLAGARDLIVKVAAAEVPAAGWTYNCPEAGFPNGSVSFAPSTCPAENAQMQLIYEPARLAAAACGARAGGALCPSGQRCGTCNFCEPVPTAGGSPLSSP